MSYRTRTVLAHHFIMGAIIMSHVMRKFSTLMVSGSMQLLR
ncbi:MAG TPA: hypothetical protein VMW22_07950 [Candidatus Desulfaltia sp.]|nr:hypothetical protein [Candidatus Desulfaltia sp.]